MASTIAVVNPNETYITRILPESKQTVPLFSPLHQTLPHQVQLLPLHPQLLHLAAVLKVASKIHKMFGKKPSDLPLQ